MFNRRTVFIIGAGASAEAKMPIGSELALTISKKLDIRFDEFGRRPVGGGDFHLFENLRRSHAEDARDVQQTCWRIRDGIHLANSIDDFLDLHRDNRRLTLVGKAAVAKCILDAEKGSNLHYDWRGSRAGINFPSLHATWLTKFMKMISRGVPVQNCDAIFENVSFVVFNYDRCLEHFILHAIQRLYGVTEQKAASICDKVTIKHPYGVLAPLATNISRDGVRYGESEDSDCVALATNIKTYTEQIEEGEELSQIRAEVDKSDCMIFLGFAFHEQNMRLLAPPTPTKPKIVFATAYGMSQDDANESIGLIHSYFPASSHHSIRMHKELKCADLFDNYSKSLAGLRVAHRMGRAKQNPSLASPLAEAFVFTACDARPILPVNPEPTCGGATNTASPQRAQHGPPSRD
jgi:hypothetical protein